MLKVVWILAATLPVVGAEFAVPIDTGKVQIENVQFIKQKTISGQTVTVPGLSFTYTMKTPVPWKTVKLLFDIAYSCNGKTEHVPKNVSLVATEWIFASVPHPLETGTFSDYDIQLAGEVDGCHDEKITAILVSAENYETRIDALEGKQTDKKAMEEERARKADAEAIQWAKDEAEKRAKVVAACKAVYDATIDKKRSDLTIRQEEQVAYCQSVNLYPPY